MKSLLRCLRFLLIVAGVVLIDLAGSASHAAPKDTWSGVERIVAVGDVHGDYGQFVRVLRAAGVIDENNSWAGGKTHLVQTGDVPDRGPDSRKAMDLLMRLEKQAKKAGGFVHALIANHEAMNVYGDLRYVHPGEYAAFRQSQSGEVRDANYPLGYFEHRRQFAPNGKYGKWICSHNAVIKINDVLFLHGGIGPNYVALTIPQINNRIRRELEDFGKLRGGMAMNPEGPLWYRGLAQRDRESEEPHLQALLDQHGANRIVMGHTIVAQAVMPRFGGRAIFIDVGMSAFYGGPAACLLIEGGQLFAIHRGKKLPLPTTDARPDLLAYLKKAAALDPAPSPLAKTIASLEAKAAAE